MKEFPLVESSKIAFSVGRNGRARACRWDARMGQHYCPEGDCVGYQCRSGSNTAATAASGDQPRSA
jgi:hypothetical protein